MSQNGVNPLTKHFRQPVLYIKLPSEGRFWPEGSLDMPVTNELPVYPMTAKDEIIIRTPDALLNGEGVVQVIQNCCPNILDAWKTPVHDIDALLVAIRIASYGPEMGIDTGCPHCNHANHHEVELQPILHSYKCPDYAQPLEINGLKIRLKPQSYADQNLRRMVQFEEDRVMQTVGDESLSDEDKMKQFNKHLTKIVDINLETVARSTAYIELPDGTRVDNREHISEYFQNCENLVFKKLLDHVQKINLQNEMPKINLQCEGCEQTYTSAIEFDYSNFFDASS